MKAVTFISFACYAFSTVSAFSPSAPVRTASQFTLPVRRSISTLKVTELQDIPPLSNPEIDFKVIALVAGQENYGFAIVALGEAIWSFLQAPSFSHAKVLVPAVLAAGILIGVSGPMVTNAADPASIKTGLEIATGVSAMLGASYVARLVAPYSPSAKEIAFLGLLVAVAGFFSFSQNLFVDGFVQLPTVDLPTVELPSVPGLGAGLHADLLGQRAPGAAQLVGSVRLHEVSHAGAESEEAQC